MIKTTAWLLMQRVGLVFAGVLYAIIAPRLLGREMFGRFALITSIVTWSVVFTEWGSLQIMARFVPPLAVRREVDGIRRLLGNLLALRALSALVTGVVATFVVRHLVQDLDSAAVALVAVLPFVVTAADGIFTLFVGLQRTPRWAMSILLRRVLMVLFIPLGYLAGGVTGALAGVAMLEIIVLGLGLALSRAWLSWSTLRLRGDVLKPRLAFGVMFFTASLLQAAFQFSGESLIRLAHGDFREISYYSAAYAMVLAAQGLFLQVLLAFSSFLTGRLVEAGPAEVEAWTRRLVRGLSFVLAPLVGGMVWFGPHVIPIVLGEEYRPAGANLSIMAWNLLLLVPGGMANVLAVVHQRPRATVAAGALRILFFWGVGAWCTQQWMSLGTAMAVLAANCAYALLFAAQVRRWTRLPLGPWMVAVAWTLMVPVLQRAWPDGWASVAGYAAWLGAGLALAMATRQMEWGELARLWQRLRMA
jgi:O-antigen/teichoic acid export membrane protein